MDFWDHKYWRDIHQNDPYANVPKVMTPHLVKHVLPNIKLILLLREPAERYFLIRFFFVLSVFKDLSIDLLVYTARSNGASMGGMSRLIPKIPDE